MVQTCIIMAGSIVQLQTLTLHYATSPKKTDAKKRCVQFQDVWISGGSLASYAPENIWEVKNLQKKCRFFSKQNQFYFVLKQNHVVSDKKKSQPEGTAEESAVGSGTGGGCVALTVAAAPAPPSPALGWLVGVDGWLDCAVRCDWPRRQESPAGAAGGRGF